MAERVRRRQDDYRTARPPHAPLRDHRDRERELALQTPRLNVTPVCPGEQTGSSRAALRQTRGGRSAPRGALLFATRTNLSQRRTGVQIGRRSGVKLQRRLTGDKPMTRPSKSSTSPSGRVRSLNGKAIIPLLPDNLG